VKDISPELQKDPLVKIVNDQLPDIQKLVTFSGSGIPTAEDVRKLNDAVAKLSSQIQNKSEAK
jgi:hypothetical protein